MDFLCHIVLAFAISYVDFMIFGRFNIRVDSLPDFYIPLIIFSLIPSLDEYYKFISIYSRPIHKVGKFINENIFEGLFHLWIIYVPIFAIMFVCPSTIVSKCYAIGVTSALFGRLMQDFVFGEIPIWFSDLRVGILRRRHPEQKPNMRNFANDAHYHIIYIAVTFVLSICMILIGSFI